MTYNSPHVELNVMLKAVGEYFQFDPIAVRDARQIAEADPKALHVYRGIVDRNSIELEQDSRVTCDSCEKFQESRCTAQKGYYSPDPTLPRLCEDFQKGNE